MIWVQQGSRPFAEGAERALIGAARMAAVYLLRHRTPGARSHEDLVPDLLEGRVSADLVAGRLGLDPATPVVVLAVAERGPGDDRQTHELRRVEIGDVVSVHATSFRRGALVGASGSRVYAVLPHAPARSAEAGLKALCDTIADVLRRRAGVDVLVGVGSPAPSFAEVMSSRAEADRVLDALTRTPERRVATIADLRAEVVLGETLDLLEARPQLRDPAVEALVAHDNAHGTGLARSLLVYLDALGDVRSAATELNVHPNTLRHRLRRAGEIGGVDLADPRARLLCHLHLHLTHRH